MISSIPFFFSKYEGAGNDFILIDDREGLFSQSLFLQIPHLCHRRFGIGADGLILLKEDPIADFRMVIFNSDGTMANGCGNGVRCLIRYLIDLGIRQQTYRIAVGDRIVEAESVGEQISVEMGKVNNLSLHYLEDVHFANTGVPHAVQFVPDVEKVCLEEITLPIRRHPQFAPDGVNVSIASFPEGGEISVRTFERGVDAETWACGTGAVAVGAIGSILFDLSNPITILFRGGKLSIFFDKETQLAKMVGPARKVFEGTPSKREASQSQFFSKMQS